jgi:hypothetical protein
VSSGHRHRVEETQAGLLVARDHNGQRLAYVYFEKEPGRRSAAKLFAKTPYLRCRHSNASRAALRLQQKQHAASMRPLIENIVSIDGR